VPSGPITKRDPVPIQVVFQGGGARLCVLMAVCELLQEYQKEGRIRISRVAGSSAGAIAAAMLSSKKPIEVFSTQLKAIGPRYVSAMRTNFLRGSWRVVNGRSYFVSLDLEKFFEDLFGENPKCVGNLEPEAKLYFTDLYSLGSRTAPKDEPLAKALAKSCRFPFALVGYSAGNTEVDGGLALNLPVDDLKKESEKGNVIGIGFSSKYGSPKNNLLSYTQQLFSAAIQSSVGRSEAILGRENVFSIDTDIGTFDFAAALKEGLGVHYNSTKAHFRTWLDSWLHKFGPIFPEMPAKASRLIRPAPSNITIPAPIVREINDRSKHEPATRAISLQGYETAVLDENGGFTGRYIAKTIMRFSIVRPTYVMEFDFQIGRGGSFTASTLGCAAIDRHGYSLRFIPHVQETTNDGDRLRSFRVYFLFDQQLTKVSPDQPYLVEYQCEADDPYPDLGNRPECSMLFRWGGADEAIHVVGFPRAKFKRPPKTRDIAAVGPERRKEAKCELGDDEVLVPSEELHHGDYIQAMELPYAQDLYFLVGRRVRNLNPGEGFGFMIE
jgi:predicted acylesterase/phospholipase RssA